MTALVEISRPSNPKHFFVPKGEIWWEFTTVLIFEFSGVQEWLWKLERVVVFLCMILQTTPKTTKIQGQMVQDHTGPQTMGEGVFCSASLQYDGQGVEWHGTAYKGHGY